MKRILHHFIALILVVVILMTNVVGVHADELVKDDTEVSDDTVDIATIFDAVAADTLQVNKRKHKFTNATDGTFNLDFAKESDYYIASAKDSGTGVTYCLIKFEDNYYVVVADGSSRYNGTYNENSFVKLESKKYNKDSKEIAITFSNKKAEYTTKITKLAYNDDFTVKLTGLYEGIHYTDGELTSDVVEISGYYNLYNEGVLVSVDGWYTVNDNKIKINNGHVSYVFDGVTCMRYTGSAIAPVKNSYIKIDGTNYRFGSNGALANGLTVIKGSTFYFVDGLMLCNSEKKTGRYYYYFNESGIAVTNTWIKHNTIYKYYNENGICTKIYYSDSYRGKYKNKLRVLNNGVWSLAKEGIYNIDGTYYLFNKKGVRYKGTKWYKENKKNYYYIKKGIVLNKLTSKGKTYKYYYNNNGMWKAAKNTWIPKFDKKQMRTNNKGMVSSIFYTKGYSDSSYQETYWNYVNSNWVKAKKTIAEVNGRFYCFNKKGRKVTNRGWYTISDNEAAYISKSGKVFKYVYFDKSIQKSVYKTGYGLLKSSAGIQKAMINGQMVYYQSDANGICTCDEAVSVGDYVYRFDKFGKAYNRVFSGAMNCDYDVWMKRVMKNLLGVTGIPCNVFVAKALQYAGGSDESVKNSIKFNSFDEGGIVINSANNCSAWVNTDVTADVVLSDGKAWQESKEYTLNANIVGFSYDNLAPGDVIVYEAGGDYEHVALYLGKFDSASDVKAYLMSLGVSEKQAEASIRTWGPYYNNDATHWCIHGGMGSSSEVYVSNTCYEIPLGASSEVATKIVKIFGK